MYSRAYVEITNICNMRCSFCHGHSREKRKMTPGEFSRVLSQLDGKTKYIYYHLMGEPFLHPDLPLFLEMAKNRGFHSIITTNGTLLNRERAEHLAPYLHKVNISLHSFEANTGIRHLDYLTQVAEFAKAATALGTIVSLRLWNKGHDEGRNDSTLTLLHRLFPQPWTENTRGYRLQDRLFLEWGDRFQWPDLAAPVQGVSVFCYGMKEHFGILCDGSVVPCCLDSEGAIILGNVFRQELSEILDSPRAKAMVHGFQCRKATEELCRRCGYAQRFT